jgi:dynactin-6
MSSRPRPTTTLPKPPTTLAPSAVIADTVTLHGTHRVIIGSDVIVHPRAKLSSMYAPITIRTGCIISEKCVVGLTQPYTDTSPTETAEPAEAYEIVLEPNVVLEPAATVEGRSIGEGTVLEAGSKVGAGAVVGRWCKIGPLCEVRPGEVLEDFTVVYGKGLRRKEKPGLEKLRARTHEMEVEVLKRLIPSNLGKFQSG